MRSTIEQLLVESGVRTSDQVLDQLFGHLVDGDSGITNVRPGGVTRTYMEMVSLTLGDLFALLRTVLEQSYVTTASGGWLDLRVADMGMVRLPATRTEGVVTMATDGEFPVSVSAGTIVATSYDVEGERLRYRATESVVIPEGVVIMDVPVAAELVGASYNVAGGTITSLVTPVPGVVSVVNDEDWLTSEGTDQETDDALRTRAMLRWAELSVGATADTYRAWALAVSGVVSAAVMDELPRGAGTLDVVIVGVAGVPSAELIEEVQEYIDQRRPLCANVLVRGPDEEPVDVSVRLVAEVGIDKAALQASAERLIESLFIYDSDDVFLGINGSLVLMPVAARLMQLVGVLDVEWLSPSGNVIPAPGHILSLGSLQVEVV
jgi:uncharacterized phage protein gp47/JayE